MWALAERQKRGQAVLNHGREVALRLAKAADAGPRRRRTRGRGQPETVTQPHPGLNPLWPPGA